MDESTDTTHQPDPGAGPDAGPVPPQQAPERPPLRRSGSDRKVAGVAGGLGRYFNVDPLIFRVVLVTLAVFGGSGLLLYAVGWLLVPEEGEHESEASRLVNGRATSRVVGALILAIVGLVAVGNFAHTGFGFGGFAALLAVGAAAYLISRSDTGGRPDRPAPPATSPAAGAYGQTPGTAYGAPPGTPYGETPGSTVAPPAPPPSAPPTWTPPPRPPRPPVPRSALGRITMSLALLAGGVLVAWNGATDHDVPAEVVLASCLGVTALGLLAGAFVGRARGLIALGVVLTIAASVAGATSGTNFRGGIGERTWSPRTVAAVERHGDYRLGIGEAKLDLRDLDVPAGQRVDISVRVGIGHLLVIMPGDVAVRADADARAGELRILSAPEVNGTDPHTRVTEPRGASPVIVLDADLGVGEVEVRRATS